MSFTRKVLRAAEQKRKKLTAKFYVKAANALALAGKITPDTPHDVATRLIGTHGERMMREAKREKWEPIPGAKYTRWHCAACGHATDGFGDAPKCGDCGATYAAPTPTARVTAVDHENKTITIGGIP